MKNINKIKEEIYIRENQIEDINRQIKRFNNRIENAINEYEKDYIRTIIQRMNAYKNWLIEEIRYLNEDYWDM